MTEHTHHDVTSDIRGQQLRVRMNGSTLFVLNQPLADRYQLTLEKEHDQYTLWMRQSCNGFARLYVTDSETLAGHIMNVTADALSLMVGEKPPSSVTYIPSHSSRMTRKDLAAYCFPFIVIIGLFILANWITPAHKAPPPRSPMVSSPVTAPPVSIPASPATTAAASELSAADVTAARQLLASRLKAGAAKQEFTVQLSSGHPRTLYFFLDPQCPNCRIFEPTVRALSAQYNVEIFPVTLLGKARTAEKVVPVLCALPQSRAERWYRLFDLADGMLNPGAKTAPQPAACETGQNALARNDMAFELYRFPGTPTVISDDGRMIPLQAMSSDSTLQAFLNAAQ